MSRTYLKLGAGAGPSAAEYTVPYANPFEGQSTLTNGAIDEGLVRSVYAHATAAAGGQVPLNLEPAYRLLCDDFLTDYEYAAAGDASASGMMDVSRIQMIDKSLFGPRNGAFGSPAS